MKPILLVELLHSSSFFLFFLEEKKKKKKDKLIKKNRLMNDTKGLFFILALPELV